MYYYKCQYFMEGVLGLEPRIKVLQTCALPFGYTPIKEQRLYIFIIYSVRPDEPRTCDSYFFIIHNDKLNTQEN